MRWAGITSLVSGVLAALFIYFRLNGWVSEATLAYEKASAEPGRSYSSGGTRLAVGITSRIRIGILTEVMPLSILVSLAVGFASSRPVRLALKPVADVNRRLASLEEGSVSLDTDSNVADTEFRELFGHIKSIFGRLIRSLEDTREYAAEVAHELRTPLQIIRLKLETNQALIDPELSEDLQQEVHRLRHVVDQVLLIAKAGRGRLTLQSSRFEISVVTHEIVQDFQLLAREENRELTISTAGLHFVEADKKYFKQILHALLTNALTHGIGEIRVKVRSHNNRARLVIVNRVGLAPGSNNLTLGLGLRVVKALLGTMSCTSFRRFSAPTVYGVQIEWATVPSSSVSRPAANPDARSSPDIPPHPAG